MMKRTIVSLPEPVYRRLRQMAAEERTSMAAIVREAVEQRLGGRTRPRPRSLGIGASGYTDTSRRAGEERAEPRSWR